MNRMISSPSTSLQVSNRTLQEFVHHTASLLNEVRNNTKINILTDITIKKVRRFVSIWCSTIITIKGDILL